MLPERFSRLAVDDDAVGRCVLGVGAAAWRAAPTFSSDVKVVNVLATIRNKQGKIVQNIAKDDFILEEDGRPQTIRYFARETDLPLTMGLLVDTSGSRKRVLGAESRASFQFLKQVVREDKDMAYEWGRSEVSFSDGQKVAHRYLTVWQWQSEGAGRSSEICPFQMTLRDNLKPQRLSGCSPP